MERRKIDEGKLPPTGTTKLATKAPQQEKKKRPSSLREGESACYSCLLTTALLSKTKILSPPFFSLTRLSATHKTPRQKHTLELTHNKLIAYLSIQDYIFWPELYWIAGELFSIALALS